MREQTVAKEIVEAFWSNKMREVGNSQAVAELYRVKNATPKELLKDFEALKIILEKAIEQIEREGLCEN